MAGYSSATVGAPSRSIGYFSTSIASILLFAAIIGMVVAARIGYDRAHPSLPQAPFVVDVNGSTWHIEYVDQPLSPINLSIMGYTECETRHIWISRRALRPRTVLMHELTHAIVCTDAKSDFTVNNLWYNSETNEGHEGIYKFTNVWSEILMRNPALAAYLGSKE